MAIAAFFGVMAGFGSILIYTFGIFLEPLQTEFGWPREMLGTALPAHLSRWVYARRC